MARFTWMIAGLTVVAMGCASKRGAEDPQPVSVANAAESPAASAAEAGVPSGPRLASEIEAELNDMLRASADELLISVDAEAAAVVDSPSWDIPITMNDAVGRWLDYFLGDGREQFKIYLTRAGRYEPMIRAVLRDAGLPEDLVYLSLIESGFSPRAYSRARAVGLWQFISGTARMYDLKISYWVDERRDPILATKAAAAHLRDLHDEFNSWYLAAAGYNGGAARVRRSIRRTGSEDFWTLSRRRYFRRETRNYVPKLIAAALIAKQPEKYGFNDIVPDPPLAYELVAVPDATSLDVIASAAGVDIDEVALLNPQILRGVTPPGVRYQVRVPPGSSHQFALNYAAIPPTERVTWVIHVVRRGDTLGEIASAYGVSMRSIRAANHNVSPRRLQIGQRLVIPRAGKIPRFAGVQVASASRSRSTAHRRTTPSRPDGPYLTHTVQTGDSLWTIAQQYAVSTRQLMRWNGLRSSRIYPGDKVRIYGSG